MSIQLKTHKMLWGRSGNLCAFPNCKKELVMDVSETDDMSVVGEEAHIVARENEGPRGKSELTSEQRNKYGNLILLCSIHHKIIDDHPNNYSVTWLQEHKKAHENWVKQNLRGDQKQKDDEIYASYIDEFLRFSVMENYELWASELLASSVRMNRVYYDSLRKLLLYIQSRVWFGRHIGLEKALLNFAFILNDLLKFFDIHSESDKGTFLRTATFYKKNWVSEEMYQKRLQDYEYHCDLIGDMVLELTRAVNYIFDKIREDLISSFRSKEGVLLITIGPFSDFSYKSCRAVYKEKERIPMPYPGLKEFMKLRVTRDSYLGEGVEDSYFSEV